MEETDNLHEINQLPAEDDTLLELPHVWMGTDPSWPQWVEPTHSRGFPL